ncbi:Na/Pi cotransporter family protein [Algoriphagus sediminis]|uniref:Na/Pi symporter n=1 Tax=Algoriphagus sediminis TaxID=3057113 RepID=A0ABT7YFM1_9BACT|nr:Na/Pi symporter [Algoriphagus sediminis]MDN3205327.1 Na/Pi symporter [Algoriphagus sediminis]
MNASILTFLFGGLILFIYSISRLSKHLEKVLSDKANEVISKFTKTVLHSLLVGILATALMGSSSAVIIITIVLINANGLSFKNSLGIILGANIGTTFSSQLFALSITDYAIFPLAIGLVIQIFAKRGYVYSLGKVLFFFGLLFFGLYMMEHSVLPLRDSEYFVSLLESIGESPFRGAWIGGLTTLIIQSSSATVGIAIVLGKQGLLSSAAGLSIMLGAELGTCSDTLLATIRGSRAAIRAGVFHVTFNLVTIALGLILFDFFLDFVTWISPTDDLGRLIANGHMVFNFLGVLTILPFLGYIERLLSGIIPDKPNVEIP